MIANFVKTFQEFPPSQESMSVQVDDLSKRINSQAIAR